MSLFLTRVVIRGKSEATQWGAWGTLCLDTSGAGMQGRLKMREVWAETEGLDVATGGIGGQGWSPWEALHAIRG